MTRENIHNLARELFAFLARRFPICCASDEFTFFPQALDEEGEGLVWDDLSPESVEDAVRALRGFSTRLSNLKNRNEGTASGNDALASLLAWVTRNLEEQFTLVRTHATQPTFTLTVATVGLVQALEGGHGKTIGDRLRTLPAFLEAASLSLDEVPELYRDQGMEMASGLARWIGSLGSHGPVASCIEAVGRYAERLSALRVRRGFHLERELLERVVERHTGSGLTVSQAIGELQEEARVLKGLLVEEAGKLGYAENWASAYDSIPGDPLPEGGKKGLLEREILRLKEHCGDLGFMGARPEDPETLAIETLPPSLASVRAADSYSARPGHPYKGGVFFIFGGGSLGHTGPLHPVYRMTLAHEAYPGHHLLDHCRWSNKTPALRSMEYPLFYEGWACFGEDLMLDTGAFERPCDRLILLRRRFRHAVRGKADLMLHSGEMDLEQTAQMLLSAGFTQERAKETVRKYALRPAYQMCYTIGRRRFRKLFEPYKKGDAATFVNTVLKSGELLFEDLEKVLERATGRGEEGKRGKGEGMS